ncbi:D-alanyl-D-alanine carboxypeptidase [Arthrobacter sp. H-02-3]|nr:D-alanyl-D-alanine carboxypeptidase [Arthrobacter sp. H-02-3]
MRAGAAGQGPGGTVAGGGCGRLQAVDQGRQGGRREHHSHPISGYRSFSQQASLYNSYVSQYGQATADTLAARAGYSEHQTGLAMDIGNASGTCALQACFANTPAGQWAAKNCRDYGFIIRYPAGAEATTGYTYEPWHLRYVGKNVALDMSSTETLEDYFGLEAAPDYLQ